MILCGRISKKERVLFIERYFYIAKISDIALKYNMNESNVKVTLKRTRDKLKMYLKEGGFYE